MDGNIDIGKDPWISLKSGEYPKPNQIAFWYDTACDKIMLFSLDDPTKHDGDFTDWMPVNMPCYIPDPPSWVMRRNELELLSHPGNTIEETLYEKGIDLPLFILKMGLPMQQINDLLEGKLPINTDIANKLEAVLNVPANYWLNREMIYREKLNQLKQSL